MTFRFTMVVVALVAVVALPGTALAATATTATPPAAKPATPTYDLDWTLPTAGKSGCNVCHGDPALVRIQDGRTVSLYVDTAELQGSAHKNVPCTSCHVDFAYKTPHDTIVKNGDEWRAVAKLSCKNCHKEAFSLFSNGAHSPAGQPGETSSTVGGPDSSAPGKPRPLCGDCHGGHAIPSKEDTAGKEAVHASAMTMCGECHVESSENYHDYYHGAPYQEGAADAPACWQCHETHQVLPADDRRSSVNENNLPDTCATCHAGEVDEEFLDYVPLIHSAEELHQENPLYAAVASVRGAFRSALDSIGSLFAG